jgi:TPR repeat protein
MEDWDVNFSPALKNCCCRSICQSCAVKLQHQPCALCRSPAPKSLAEIQARLRRHVENEVPEAITHFAAAHLNGKYGIKKSSKKAAKLYKRAVELGNVDAMVSLASLYVRGDGVKLDEKKAEQLLRMGADRGDARAQNNLACALIRNDPDWSDMKETQNEIFQLALLSAEQGYTQAEGLVGGAYLAGIGGVPQNLEEARRWLARAAAKGDEGAKDDLARLDAVTAR